MVKVLDFGLAKALDVTPQGDPSLSPTLTAATQMGVIMGTAAYMSPEQARGKRHEGDDSTEVTSESEIGRKANESLRPGAVPSRRYVLLSTTHRVSTISVDGRVRG